MAWQHFIVKFQISEKTKNRKIKIMNELIENLRSFMDSNQTWYEHPGIAIINFQTYTYYQITQL